ncbi:MAG TPA: FtsX-like permease family protein, partial [Sphingomicrobium sp.]|nr:FtsX-like permease family protein [Sphingomicrobium sp.]
LTFSKALPPGNKIVAGRWWPENYAGPPLISLDADAATALGLHVGDRLTVTVLGRPIEARIASLRQIDWRSMGFNFAIIFAPGTLEKAPYTLLATIAPREGQSVQPVERALSSQLPMVSTIRVREVIDQLSAILVALDRAVRIATGFAILVGVVVLAGSVVATRRSRQRDSVLLKLVGATRREVLTVQLIEFAVLSSAVAAAAFLAGIAGAWALVRYMFDLAFAPDWAMLLILPLAAIAVAVSAALTAALPALSARPAAALRAL